MNNPPGVRRETPSADSSAPKMPTARPGGGLVRCWTSPGEECTHGDWKSRKVEGTQPGAFRVFFGAAGGGGNAGSGKGVAASKPPPRRHSCNRETGETRGGRWVDPKVGEEAAHHRLVGLTPPRGCWDAFGLKKAPGESFLYLPIERRVWWLERGGEEAGIKRRAWLPAPPPPKWDVVMRQVDQKTRATPS